MNMLPHHLVADIDISKLSISGSQNIYIQTHRYFNDASDLLIKYL